MRKFEPFTKILDIYEKMKPKNRNLVINCYDVNKILECLFDKSRSHNDWMKTIIQEFLDNKEI